MRRTNLKKYELWTTEGTDDYGQPNPPSYSGRDIECNIAMSTQVVDQEDVRRVLTYFTGLTVEKDVYTGQELRNEKERFGILEVNPYARRTQLTLEAL